MGIFNKIKDVLFTEEETTEIPLIQKEDDFTIDEKEEKVEEEISRFNNFKIEENTTKFEEVKEIRPEVKKEVIRPVEKTPFQSFDEEEFDRIAAINKNRLLERDRRAREEKERQTRHVYEEKKVEVRMPKQETHKFKPTPVISPVYGILDKNYTKDDILPTASSEGTLPKIIDVDAVRQKAFGTLDQIEKNIEEDNLDNIKITSFDDEDDNKIVLPEMDIIDEEITTPLPKIEDVEKELEQDDLVLPVEEDFNEIENVTDSVEDTEIEPVNNISEDKKEDEIENDLFNLIDSMYQEEGDN